MSGFGVVRSGAGRVYRKDELLGYLEYCRKKLDAVMVRLTEARVAHACPLEYRAMSNENCSCTICATSNTKLN